MEEGSLAPESLERVCAVLQSGPPLRLAMLFGSAARNQLRATSDVDIAILPADSRMSLRAELDLQVALERACQRQVDLVRLDHASTLLRWEVARAGKPLLDPSATEAARFVAEAASEYFDFQPAFAQASAVFRRALAAADSEER